MKSILRSLFANLASLTCVLGAIFLAGTNKAGWGWFLFAAVVLDVGDATLSGGEKSLDDAEN